MSKFDIRGRKNLEDGDYMKFGRVVLALAFSLAFILMTVSVPAPVKGSVTLLELVPGKYTDTNVYVPGEVMDIVVHGDTANETFEIMSLVGFESNIPGGNIMIPEIGSVKVSWEIPDIPDGEYSIIVRRPNGAIEETANFFVQGYSFNIETDRNAYLRGDETRVFWTANNINDQTLPAPGIGKLAVFKQDPNNLSDIEQIISTHTFSEAAGSATFTLPTVVNLSMRYFVDGWFNSTTTNPDRSQHSRAYFDINPLGVIVNLDKNQYAAGSIMRIQIITYATANQTNPSHTDTPEPGCDVTIQIFKEGIIGALETISDLKTDSHGLVEFIVLLDEEDYVDDDYMYRVEVGASKYQLDDVTEIIPFNIAASSSIGIVVDFSRTQYASGEMLFGNTTASSIGGTTDPSYTYIIEIRNNNTEGTLFSRNTQSTGNFSFDIPDNFEGWLWVRVTVDDGAGNSASAVQQVRVNYAIVLVNVNKENYNAEDELTINYEVIGSLLENPATFYVVYDKEGSVVEEGTAANGSFSFMVPSAPSESYIFTIFASGNGRVVQGTDSAYLFSGYVLLLDFNRASYEPGDSMAIDYQIIIMGDADIPGTFTLTYGLVNGPQASLQTGDLSGSLMYLIPEDIDQGEQLFMASCDFGATTNEVVVVKDGANLLWYLRIGDIPLFSIFLLFLTFFSLYIALRTRSRVRKIQKGGMVPASTGPGPIQKRLQQDSSGQRIKCAECGDPIEITTSRRPIEIMCPHCGEIQHIE